MEEKICTKCNKPWPRTEFNTHKRWKDGLHPWCRTCFNAATKAYYHKKSAENPPGYRWNRDVIRHTYFSDVNSPMQAYLLGLLAADGNIVSSVPRIGLELSTKDNDLLTLVRDELAPGHTIRIRNRKESTSFGSGESGALAFTSPEMVAHLAHFGIVPKKTSLLRWPSLLPDHLSAAFILGYFDGDGNITWTINNGHAYPKWVITSGSIDFLSEIIVIVKKHLGITIGGPYLKQNTRTYTIGVTGKKAFLLDKWLHESGLGLERKRIHPK